MASTALRLRRALSLSSVISARSTTAATFHRTPISRFPFASPSPTTSPTPNPEIGSHSIHTTSLSLSAARSFNQGFPDQIDEDTILFAGCDYNHWLVTMDFPKDPPPSPEQMVETYVQTLAKFFGSVEEANKRMYACSTTTYQGFQCVMDEETAKKFEASELPGVVFVLPDSYIDPVNKEYGGDKYVNGTIYPRPPPVQYGRSRRPRDQQNYPPRDNHGPGQNYPPRDNRGPTQNFMPRDNHGPAQNFMPRENHGPAQNYPPQDNRGPAQNYPPPDNRGPAQNYPPPDNRGPAQNYASQQNYGPSQNYPPQQNYAPRQNYQPQQSYAPPQQNVSPPRQGERMDSPPQYNQGAYNQGTGYPLRNQSSQNFTPPSPSEGSQYGESGRGSYGQNQAGYGNGPRVEGANSGFGQGFAENSQNRQFNHPDGQQNVDGQKPPNNYPPMGQTGRD